MCVACRVTSTGYSTLRPRCDVDLLALTLPVRTVQYTPSRSIHARRAEAQRIRRCWVHLVRNYRPDIDVGPNEDLLT